MEFLSYFVIQFKILIKFPIKQFILKHHLNFLFEYFIINSLKSKKNKLLIFKKIIKILKLLYCYDYFFSFFSFYDVILYFNNLFLTNFWHSFLSEFI